MPRLTTPAAVRIYAAAQRFINNALRADDSLFTPGTPIWTAAVIDDLYLRFVEHPDVSADSFENKFRRQLLGLALETPENAAPTTYQLAGELLYLHLLPANGISARSKRNSINTVLQWSPAPVSIPSDLDEALEGGIAKASQYYLIGRPFQLTFLLEFARHWKRLEASLREQYLHDPWAFKSFVETVPVGSAHAQRLLLLHLVHPETFEPIMAKDHKQKIVEAFKGLTDPALIDVDQQLIQIRTRLTPEYGEGFNFYEERVKQRWLENDTSTDPDEELDDSEVGASGDTADEPPTATTLAEWQKGVIAWSGNRMTHEMAADFPGWLQHTYGTRVAIQIINYRGLRIIIDGQSELDIWFNRVRGVYVGLSEPNRWDLVFLRARLSSPGNVKETRMILRTSADYLLFKQQLLEIYPQHHTVFPRSLGSELSAYTNLITRLGNDTYTPTTLRDVARETITSASGIKSPEPMHLINDLMQLRLLEQLDDGKYRAWPYLSDATPDLLLKYAALTLLVPGVDDTYKLPALEAPFDGLPHPIDRWPLGELLLQWYEEAGLVQHNSDGTWQSVPGVLDPVSGSTEMGRNLNIFLANLRRARSAPTDLEDLRDSPLPMLRRDVLDARIREIQSQLLIDRETILRIYRSLIAGQHVILSGPPGTGKTHLARVLPRILWRDHTDTVRVTLPNDPTLSPVESLQEDPIRREGYLVDVVTATEDWGVRHVLGGITPKVQSNERGSTLIYTVTPGCLTRTVLANYQFEGDVPDHDQELPRREHIDSKGNRYRGTWLVIDEFTRAQVDSAFGGLLTTLGGQQPTLTFPTESGDRIVRLPRDFRLIGTLNSFDRHFLNQISEAMKRRFVFIDVLPPARDRRDEEQAIAIFRAISTLHDHAVTGFTAELALGRASWDKGLSVHQSDHQDDDGMLTRYEVSWPSDPVVRDTCDALWRLFAAARVYRQLGTAQAEAAYRALFAGYAVEFERGLALDSALADILADQLQVIARDEIRVLLALLSHPSDSERLCAEIINILSKLTSARQSAHLLQLRLIDPTVDVNKPDALTTAQVETIFGTSAPLPFSAQGLFARRLTAFVNEQGL